MIIEAAAKRKKGGMRNEKRQRELAAIERLEQWLRITRSAIKMDAERDD